MHPAVIAGLASVLVGAACAPERPPVVAATSEVVCGEAELVAPGTISTDRSEVRLALAPDESLMLWGTIGWEGGAGGLDIRERRKAGDGRWLEPAPVSFNSADNDFDPSQASLW